LSDWPIPVSDATQHPKEKVKITARAVAAAVVMMGLIFVVALAFLIAL
jgi:hypothetical protein